MGRPAYDTEAEMQKALAALDEGRETQVTIKDEKEAADLRASLPVSTETVDDVDELLDAISRDPNECGCGDERCDDLCGPIEADGRHYARHHDYAAPDNAGPECYHSRRCPADRHYVEGSLAVMEPPKLVMVCDDCGGRSYETPPHASDCRFWRHLGVTLAS